MDENDQGSGAQPYSLTPSHNPVATGSVQFNVYNFGQDPHTFAILDSSGNRVTLQDSSGQSSTGASVPSGQTQDAVTVTAQLAPGSYTLLCTLTNHAHLGMQATLTVR